MKGVFATALYRVLQGSLLALALPAMHSVGAEDDVYLARLVDDKVVDVVNVSNRLGYDNQPHFAEGGKVLLYTAMFNQPPNAANSAQPATQAKTQTDIIQYDINSASQRNITNSSASEYSPTITPDGQHFSVIRVAEDGRQLLYRYAYDTVYQQTEEAKSATASMTSLLPEVYDVGYHTWLNEDELLLFVLGEPMQLMRASIDKGSVSMVDSDIGRTLRAVPDDGKSARFSYTKHVADRWQLKVYHRDSKAVSEHTILPADNMYYTWHPDGRLLSASAATVMVNKQWQDTDNWQVFADLSEYCKGTISRMVISEQGDKFAFVCSLSDQP